MITPKELALIFLNWLLRILIFLTVLTSAVLVGLGTPQHIKSALIGADSYERFVTEVIRTNNATDQKSLISFENKNVQKIIKEEFPPNELQIKTEKVIDGFYAWLELETSEPKFTVDFTQNVDEVSRKLSSYIVLSFADKPECGYYYETIDITELSCLPTNINLAQEQSNLQAELNKEGVILPQKVFTEQDLPKNNENQTIAQAFPYIPTLFSLLKIAPFIFGGFTIIIATLLVSLSTIKRRALRQLGSNLLMNGLLICSTPLFIAFALPYLNRRFSSGFGNSGGVQAILNEVLNKINFVVNYYLLIFGFLVVLVGFSIMLLERSSRPRRKYAQLEKRAGIISAYGKRTANGRFKLDPQKVPIQSSEISTTKKPKKKSDKKYRKLAKKGW